MKEIYLTKGKVAFVDDEDFEHLNQWKWNADKVGCNYYAKRTYIKADLTRGSIYMHRVVMKAEKGEIIDHKDGNGLNNQKNNTRKCTSSQNNTNKQGRGLSKYRGVCWNKDRNKWKSQIFVNKKEIFLGLFKDEIEAAIAYNKSALIHHGEFARLNTFI